MKVPAGSGRVYLVGAGPGDPGLLTLKGAQAIAAADVIVYDRLVHPAILRHAREDAELIYAGKTPDRHTLRQEEINELLVSHGREGRVVARVKGGDPFVFGRGGEEAEALAAAGVPFEVIPGVTSAIAVPAYAGIPVTHRDCASSLGIVTGHEDPAKEESSLDWQALARGVDTLVFLMGVGNLAQIVSRLIDNGRSADAPAAVIEWGTRPEQHTVTAPLRSIAQAAEEDAVKPPAILVVGEVVRLREKLRWFDIRPLSGRHVVVTRSREQASDLTEALEALGAGVIEFPVIACRPLEESDALERLDRAIEELESYDWVVFTSANGVRFFLDRIFRLGGDVRALAGIQIGVMGEGTRRAVEERSLTVDFVPGRFVGEAFVEEFPEKRPGVRVLIPRAAEARELIPEQLRRHGCEVDVVPCYRTVAADTDSAELRLMLAAGAVDAVTFTSSSTVRNFVRLAGLDDPGFRLPETVRVVSIGPVTTRTAREMGLPVHAEAEPHTIGGVVQAVLELLAPPAPRDG